MLLDLLEVLVVAAFATSFASSASILKMRSPRNLWRVSNLHSAILGKIISKLANIYRKWYTYVQGIGGETFDNAVGEVFRREVANLSKALVSMSPMGLSSSTRFEKDEEN
jgi:hypothetical protein